MPKEKMKIIGYLLAIIGIAGLAIAMVPEIGALVELPEQIDGTTLIIASIVLAAIGVFLIVRSGGGGKRRKGMEVPIYHGKEIVGYRRT